MSRLRLRPSVEKKQNDAASGGATRPRAALCARGRGTQHISLIAAASGRMTDPSISATLSSIVCNLMTGRDVVSVLEHRYELARENEARAERPGMDR